MKDVASADKCKTMKICWAHEVITVFGPCPSACHCTPPRATMTFTRTIQPASQAYANVLQKMIVCASIGLVSFWGPLFPGRILMAGEPEVLSRLPGNVLPLTHAITIEGSASNGWAAGDRQDPVLGVLLSRLCPLAF